MSSHRNQGGSHLVNLIRSTVPPMHPGGRPIVTGIVGASVGVRALLRLVGLKRTGRVLGRTGLITAGASAIFFRNPPRVAPVERGLVVAAADGVVSLIEDAIPPVELGLPAEPRRRVSVFLSIFDVHVQRIPLDGTVITSVYKPGKFLSADLDKASDVNERNSLVIRPADGGEDLVVTQIAGLVARRIVCEVQAGAAVRTGDVYGLIRFGSRVDIYLPAGAEVKVALGQRTVGGETVIATLAAPVAG